MINTLLIVSAILILFSIPSLITWYAERVRTKQPVDNSDPFAVPDLDRHAAEGSPAPERASALMKSINDAATERGMTLDEYMNDILERAMNSPYPTKDCLTQTELEYAA